jgi:hypothetical protein
MIDLASKFGAPVRAALLAAVLAVALAAAVSVANAQPGAPAETNGLGNLVAYGGCAGGLAISNTFTQAWAAMLVCARIIADEWNRTF